MTGAAVLMVSRTQEGDGSEIASNMVMSAEESGALCLLMQNKISWSPFRINKNNSCALKIFLQEMGLISKTVGENER